MDFMTAISAFLAFGLMFCYCEHIAINYIIPHNDEETYGVVVLAATLFLAAAIVALTLAICELLQLGMTYSQLGFDCAVIIALLLSMMPAWVVDRYHNNLFAPPQAKTYHKE